MTNEQAKEILRCNTNLGNGVIIENKSTQLIYEALEIAIKALEQTTSDDCVSREKVWYMITGGKYPNEDYEQFIERLVKELENMPSVTPTQRWIPVSERLPEKYGYYLCSLYYAIPPYHIFHPEDDTYIHDVSVQKFDGESFCASVKAWMELPKPYEEKRGNENG